jgi:hypothetical protein
MLFQKLLIAKMQCQNEAIILLQLRKSQKKVKLIST